jgi:hypothetical protein
VTSDRFSAMWFPGTRVSLDDNFVAKVKYRIISSIKLLYKNS